MSHSVLFFFNSFKGANMKSDMTSKKQSTLNKNNIQIATERVDDVPLLIGQMLNMGLPEILDKHIPAHGNQRKLSWGWTAVIWLAYILTEGDHRKVAVSEYICEMKYTLSCLTGQEIDVLDFNDDRLSHLLKHLRKPETWKKIEGDLNERTIEVYEIEPEVIRCDATTVSLDQEVTEDGLVQFGHSKDNPKLPQIKLMCGSLDPMGMPLASDVVSGERADDGLYIPVIDRINESLKKPGLLFSGDCKMSSLEIRAHLLASGHHYLCPLPLTGKTVEEMEQWITQGIVKNQENILTPVFRENYKGEQVFTASGYELNRFQQFEKDGNKMQWEERVLVVHSPAHADRQSAGFETRLGKAKTKIEALTPPRGRGKRQITNETDLLQAITKVLKEYRVEGFLHVEYEKQVETTTKFIGKGRGSNDREKRVDEKIRYQIISVEKNKEKIDEQKKRFGWKAFAIDLSADKLSLEDAVLSYRNEYRIERIFNRLKSRLNIAPLFVRKDDQIEGLTYLLTLGVRVLTLIEFVIQRSLKQDNTGLAGMHPENRKKLAKKPSAERIQKAFSKINLTIIRDMSGNVILRSLTPLTSLQEEIMQRLKIHPSVYHKLEN